MGLSISFDPEGGYFRMSGFDMPDWEVTFDQGLQIAKVIQKAKNLGAAGVRLGPDSFTVLWRGRPRRDPVHFTIALVYKSGVERDVRVSRSQFFSWADTLRTSIEKAIVQSVMGS